MKLRVGYQLTYSCPQATPMVLILSTHACNAEQVIVADEMLTAPRIPFTQYHDSFGNLLRISVNVTADFGNVTDSARLGVARFRL